MRNNPIGLEGSTILLTGATRGIGRALCGQLVDKGATVVALARDSEALGCLADGAPDRIMPVACDLSDPASRTAAIEAVMRDQPMLNGLINNAGVQTEMPFFVPDRSDLPSLAADEIEINLTAAIHLTARLIPGLAAQPRSFVVNLTSGLAIAPKEASPVYSATKSGLRSFTKALRYQADTSGRSVRVIEVVMALVDTDMTQGRGRGKISPERAAREIIAGIETGRDEIWIAKARWLPILGRISPRLPERILR